MTSLQRQRHLESSPRQGRSAWLGPLLMLFAAAAVALTFFGGR